MAPLALNLTTSGNNFTLTHYPFGTKDQRISNGTISNVRGSLGCYEVDTLGGSSGAPLFNDSNEIVGIHVSGHENRDLAIRYDDGVNIHRLSPSTENRCVLINQSFITTLRGRNAVRL